MRQLVLSDINHLWHLSTAKKDYAKRHTTGGRSARVKDRVNHTPPAASAHDPRGSQPDRHPPRPRRKGGSLGDGANDGGRLTRGSRRFLSFPLPKKFCDTLGPAKTFLHGLGGPMRKVTTSPDPIVSMIEFKGRVLVATTRRVYELVDAKSAPLLVALEFVFEDDRERPYPAMFASGHVDGL